MGDAVTWWNVTIYGAALVTFWRLGSCLTDVAKAMREPRSVNVRLDEIKVNAPTSAPPREAASDGE